MSSLVWIILTAMPIDPDFQYLRDLDQVAYSELGNDCDLIDDFNALCVAETHSKGLVFE